MACGNFVAPRSRSSSDPAVQKESPSLTKADVYTASLDTWALRIQLRLTALKRWGCGSLDIRKAFLWAPLETEAHEGRAIIMRLPRVTELAGLCQPGERWIVRKAVYGLVESPKACARSSSYLVPTSRTSRA